MVNLLEQNALTSSDAVRVNDCASERSTVTSFATIDNAATFSE